ncbi:ATP-binding cassette domain-containing protein [Corallincola luteus]|uniref:ATP-binding cassette domain-containing protein n=1 Tax=Corallincola luteus TaxID=1775177 RepID=A0ABY2APN4_9GAMM|nr:ATP-binding cassette domain-containing protein [Corallincola luteus]TCI03705.1 ATP-binding cassette domain-containing protein [Corallincola luteus]
MIELKQIELSYDNALILEQINISLRPQGVTSIIGPNGAGKSSLLSIASRLLKPNNGEVLLDGHDIHQMDSQLVATRLAILRQENHITARLTVNELVCFGRYPYHRGRPTDHDWQQVEQALCHLDLIPLRDRYLDELSGGQRQRAFIAMVFAQDTQYLMLDEPLNNLDMKHSSGLMKQLRRAADELNKSVILVLHDINFAACYSDEIIAMRDGKVLYQLSSTQLMDNQKLANIYDMPLTVEQLHGKPVCLYHL